jgi:hypothetical protein
MSRKLGRLPHDPVRLAEAPRHTFGAMPPPIRLDRSHMDYTPGMYGNDTYPDCTFVSLTNAARVVAQTHRFSLNVDATLPLKDYADFLGDPPDLESTDGAVMQDVLDWQAKTGLNIGPERLFGVAKTIDLTDRRALALAVWSLGHIWLGVTLFERDMENNASHKPWDVQDGRDDGKVEGGHAVNVWDYLGLGDSATGRLGTWGDWQQFTWPWLMARADEAHVLTWAQLAAAPDGPTVEEMGI